MDVTTWDLQECVYLYLGSAAAAAATAMYRLGKAGIKVRHGEAEIERGAWGDVAMIGRMISEITRMTAFSEQGREGRGSGRGRHAGESEVDKSHGLKKT